MIFLSAVILSVSIGCIFWSVLRKRDSLILVNDRLAAVKTGAMKATGAMLLDGVFRKDNTGKKFRLESIKSDQMERNLFLSGVQSERALLWIRRIRRGALILPVLLVLFYAVSGSLTSSRAIYAMCFGVISLFTMQWLLKKAREKRQSKILRYLPQFMDMLVVGAEAGLSFFAALERILPELDSKEPLAQEMRLLHNEIMSGLSLTEVCKRLDLRCEIPDLSLLLGSIMQTDQIGSSLAGTLKAQASEIREKYRQRLRLRAMKIPVKILFPVVLIFMSMLILLLGIVFFQLATVVGGAFGSPEKVAHMGEHHT